MGVLHPKCFSHFVRERRPKYDPVASLSKYSIEFETFPVRLLCGVPCRCSEGDSNICEFIGERAYLKLRNDSKSQLAILKFSASSGIISESLN